MLREFFELPKRYFVLTIGDDGAILIYMEGRRVLRRLYSPGPEPQDVQIFLELFSADPQAPLYILADVMDQSYSPQSLPPVSALSISKLIQKRLERDLAPDDIKGAIPIGRSEEGRKDWHYLFISIPNIPPLTQWLELVAELPNRLLGIHLVPVEGQNFIAGMRSLNVGEDNTTSDSEVAEWELMVSHNKVGGFRQIVLRNGTLIFTRLTQPVGEALPDVIAGNVEQEISNTVEYLKRLAYNEQSTFDITVIVSQEIKEVITPSNLPNCRQVRIFTPHEVAVGLKLQQATEEGDHFGDVVMAASFCTSKKKVLSLQTDYSKKLNQFYDARRLSRIAAVIIIPFVLSGIGYKSWEMFQLSKDIEYSRTLEQEARQNLTNVENKKEVLPLDIDRITDVVALYEVLSAGEMTPLPLIARFGQALNDEVLVKSVNWKASNFLALKKGEQSKVSVVFEVEFLKSHDQIEDFLREANLFFARLRNLMPEYTVDYSKLPGTVSKDEAMEIDFSERSALPEQIASGAITVEVTISGPRSQDDNGSEEPKKKTKRKG